MRDRTDNQWGRSRVFYLKKHIIIRMSGNGTTQLILTKRINAKKYDLILFGLILIVK